MEGEGARLAYRYVDSVLTDELLWPWPMEDRIQAELGYSVTNSIIPILDQAGVPHGYNQPIPTLTPTPTGPTSTPAPTNIPTITPTPATNSGITNLTVSNSTDPNPYQLTGNLQGSSLMYIDRALTFTDIPSYLSGVFYIKTANDDKQLQTGEPNNFSVSFDLTKDATIHIAFDDRVDTDPNTTGNQPPSWLTTNFTDTGDSMINNTFSIYKKEYQSAQNVTLGGNEGQSTNTSMYSIIIVPSPSLPGDVNGDGQVTITDLSSLLASFGSTVTPNTGADFNGDGSVTISDLATLLANFGTAN